MTAGAPVRAARLRPGPSTTLMLAQVAGQLGLVVAVAVLTRIFSPAELGLWQLATAVALAVQPIAVLRLDQVIPVVEATGVEAALQRAYRALACTCAVALLVGVGAWWTFGPDALLVATMVVLLLVSFAWTLLDNARLIRADLRGRLAARNLISGLVTALLQVLTAWATHNLLAVGAATLAGRALALAVTRTGPVVFPTREVEEFRRPDNGTLTGIASATAANGVLQLPVLLLSAAFGTVAAGLLGVAQRLAGLPVALLGQGIAQVTQISFGTALRTGAAVEPVLGRHLRRLALLALPAAGLLAVLGPLLAGPLLGTAWAAAGTVVAVLAVPLAVQLVVSPVLVLLVVLARERLLLAVQMFRAVLIVVAVGVSVVLGAGLLAALTAVAGAVVAGYLVALAAVVLAAREHDSGARQ